MLPVENREVEMPKLRGGNAETERWKCREVEMPKLALARLRVQSKIRTITPEVKFPDFSILRILFAQSSA